ncbi:phage antirepressor KilAC domain-containing protein [Pseudomonas sp. SDO5532_S415]
MSNIVSIKDAQTTEIMIGGFYVRRDREGRYCLNDFHKAAGGAPRHKPTLWVRQAEDLISELAKGTDSYPLQTKAGRYGGTYVAKELVYDYAMWISSEYHLKVIRAYDRLATSGVAVHENAALYVLDNPEPYLNTIIQQAQALTEGYTQLALNAERDAPKIEFHDAVNRASNLQTVSEVAKKYGIGRNKLFELLRNGKVLMTDKYNTPYQRYIDSRHFVVVGKVYSEAGNTYRSNKTMVTGKGEIYIGKLLREAGWLPVELAA